VNGDWLLRGRDGRLCVYLPSGDAVSCRAELGPDGPWEAPRRIGGDQRLRPGLAVGVGADRYAHLVAWRPTGRGQSGLVHSTHYRPRLAPLDWSPVGHPDRKGARTGTPAVAVDAQGRAHLFVRNAAGGMSVRIQQEKGGWEPWRELGGAGLQEEPAAVPGESGLVEAYAAADGVLLHWRQEKPGAQPVLDASVEAAVRPGTLRALATSAGHTTLFFTDDSSGDLCAWRPGGTPVALVAAAGPGPVAAVRCVIEGHDCTLLGQRSAGGRVAFAAYPTEREAAGAWWAESGPALADDAGLALTVDETDRVVAVTLSPSGGRLLLTRRKDEPGLALTAWQQV
jgi:hypothetical protein